MQSILGRAKACGDRVQNSLGRVEGRTTQKGMDALHESQSSCDSGILALHTHTQIPPHKFSLNLGPKLFGMLMWDPGIFSSEPAQVFPERCWDFRERFPHLQDGQGDEGSSGSNVLSAFLEPFRTMDSILRLYVSEICATQDHKSHDHQGVCRRTGQVTSK